MKVCIQVAILTFTLMNISIPLAILTSRLREYRSFELVGPRFALHESQCYRGNTDIYSCEPQYYSCNTYIKAAETKIAAPIVARFAPY